MKKRFLALFLALCMILAATPVASGVAPQKITVDTAYVYPGQWTSVTIWAENFEQIASLEAEIYYDADVLTLNSTQYGEMLSATQNSVNTTQSGVVKLASISLDGISGNGDLLTLHFTAKPDCAPGTYPVRIAIGGVYDTQLAAVEVSGVNGSISVMQPYESKTAYDIYAGCSQWCLQKGDMLNYQVYSWDSSREFVSASFLLTYDHEIFSVESVNLSQTLTGDGGIYSINTSVLGQIRIAYASQEPVSPYRLFDVDLKVIGNVSTTTEISAEAFHVYQEDLTPYLPGSCCEYFTIEQLPEVMDYPDACLQMQKPLVMGRQTESLFLLEAGASVAAADFTITYDPGMLRCVSVSEAEDLDGMVVINAKYDQGKIRFSYVNMQPDSQKDAALVKILWEPVKSSASHGQITMTGVGVVDAQQNPITLEYVPNTGCIYGATVTDPTCGEGGYTTYTCACGYSYQGDFVDPLAHSQMTRFDRVEPDHYHDGNKEYWRCNTCGLYFLDAQAKTQALAAELILPMIPHSYVGGHDENYHWGECACGHTIQKTAHDFVNSCDTTCDTCGYTRAGGHRFSTDWSMDADYHWHKCTACGEADHKESHHKISATECSICGVLYMTGDFTGDRVVNSKDVAYLLWHTLFSTSYPISQNADFTDDGIVNSKDVAYLLWHTLFPNSYPI